MQLTSCVLARLSRRPEHCLIEFDWAKALNLNLQQHLWRRAATCISTAKKDGGGLSLRYQGRRRGCDGSSNNHHDKKPYFLLISQEWERMRFPQLDINGPGAHGID